MILHNDVFYKGILGIYTSATRLVCTFQVPLPPVDDRKKMVEEVGKDRRYAIDNEGQESSNSSTANFGVC